MNQEELTGKLTFDELTRKQTLEKEFEKLGPGLRSSLLRYMGALASILFIVWLHPEIIEQPILYLMLLLIFGVSAEIHHESKRINKRMDTLYKLLKDKT